MTVTMGKLSDPDIVIEFHEPILLIWLRMLIEEILQPFSMPVMYLIIT